MTNTAPPVAPPATLEELFDEHHGRVFAAAYRVTGSAADAEDVLQTVFLRLAGREGPLDFSPSPGSYLRRAAVNAAIDIVRARWSSDRSTLEEAPPLRLVSTDPGPEQEQETRELRDQLRAAIAVLPERGGEMFALRYFEGLSNEEIADAMGTTANTVAVTLHRVRGKLRDQLGAQGEGGRS